MEAVWPTFSWPLWRGCFCCKSTKDLDFHEFQWLESCFWWNWQFGQWLTLLTASRGWRCRGCCSDGGWGTLKTWLEAGGSLEKDALRYNLKGLLFETWGCFRPYFGGLASEDADLHLRGKVGKCILSKDGWKTDSALPGGTRCKYNTKVFGQSYCRQALLKLLQAPWLKTGRFGIFRASSIRAPWRVITALKIRSFNCRGSPATLSCRGW